MSAKNEPTTASTRRPKSGAGFSKPRGLSSECSKENRQKRTGSGLAAATAGASKVGHVSNTNASQKKGTAPPRKLKGPPGLKPPFQFHNTVKEPEDDEKQARSFFFTIDGSEGDSNSVEPAVEIDDVLDKEVASIIDSQNATAEEQGNDSNEPPRPDTATLCRGKPAPQRPYRVPVVVKAKQKAQITPRHTTRELKMSTTPRDNPKQPFVETSETNSTVSKGLLKQARKSGELNLSNKQLCFVPDSVWRINLDAPEEARHITSLNSSKSEERWWEQVALTKLNLSSNSLIDLGRDVSNLTSLAHLDVHDNHLESLPDGLRVLTCLEKLDCSHNQLTSLPDGLFTLKGLLQLQASHNQLTDLNDDIGNLSLLENLDVSHNKIPELPATIGFLTRVRMMDASYNELSSLPQELGSMDALAYLNVEHNKIQSVEDIVGFQTHLEVLNLRHNMIGSVPRLCSCHALKELYLGNNHLKGIFPEVLETLVSVKVLELRDNHIEKLPDEICLLQGLERLDLTCNDLTDLPYRLGTLPHLKQLLIESNPLRKIRRDIAKRGTAALLKWLRERIEQEPGKADEMEKTTFFENNNLLNQRHYINTTRLLDFSNKNAVEIPEDIWAVGVSSQVQSLNLSKNSFTSLPDEIVQVSQSIVDINVGFNKLELLTPQVGSFKFLQFLNLRNNLLSELPIELENCQGLQELVLSSNRFKRKIPEVVFKLSNLENLLMSDNHVSVIDIPGLLRMTKIASLDLTNNDLETVPPELGNVTTLRSLQIGGNPFRIPRRNILDKGTQAILEYLRSRIVTNTDNTDQQTT